MAAVTAAVAVGASAVGGAMKARAQSKAAKRAAKMAQFNPYDITGAGGRVTFGPDGQAQVRDDAQMAMFREMFGTQAANLLGGNAFGQGVTNFANVAGNELMPGLFSGALDASFATPDQAFQQFGDYAATNALFGQAGGMSALAQAQDFGTRETGINEQYAQQLFGFGQEALGQTDFRDVSEAQIARQRQLARPMEERAVNSKFQNLLNRGVLSQTGGQRQVGELALAQEQADIMRVGAGEQFANMLAQQNRQFGLSAMGAGFGAREQDRLSNLQRANLFAGVGQNLLGFGQGAAQQGLASQVQFSDMINSRGQQRLANISQLLGFGQGMQQQNINAALGLFGGIRGMNADLRNLIALGGNLGGQQSAAGAQAGQFLMQGANSTGGAFLSGVGSGLMGALGGGFLPGTG